MINEREEWLKALRAVPTVARALVAGLDDGAARRRPAEGEWAVVEVVAHMADTDERALARIERMLREDTPDLPGFDQAALAIESRYIDRSLAPEIDRLERAVGSLVNRLDGLDDTGWGRTGRHAEHGRMSIEAYLAHVAGEDVDHLAQIARLVA